MGSSNVILTPRPVAALRHYSRLARRERQCTGTQVDKVDKGRRLCDSICYFLWIAKIHQPLTQSSVRDSERQCHIFSSSPGLAFSPLAISLAPNYNDEQPASPSLPTSEAEAFSLWSVYKSGIVHSVFDLILSVLKYCWRSGYIVIRALTARLPYISISNNGERPGASPFGPDTSWHRGRFELLLLADGSLFRLGDNHECNASLMMVPSKPRQLVTNRRRTPD